MTIEAERVEKERQLESLADERQRLTLETAVLGLLGVLRRVTRDQQGERRRQSNR